MVPMCVLDGELERRKACANHADSDVETDRSGRQNLAPLPSSICSDGCAALPTVLRIDFRVLLLTVHGPMAPTLKEEKA